MDVESANGRNLLEIFGKSVVRMSIVDTNTINRGRTAMLAYIVCVCIRLRTCKLPEYPYSVLCNVVAGWLACRVRIRIARHKYFVYTHRTKYVNNNNSSGSRSAYITYATCHPKCMYSSGCMCGRTCVCVCVNGMHRMFLIKSME